MEVQRMRHNYIYWLPRILSIIVIIFYALFSLDVITSDLGIEGKRLIK